MSSSETNINPLHLISMASCAQARCIFQSDAFTVCGAAAAEWNDGDFSNDAQYSKSEEAPAPEVEAGTECA